MPYTKTFSGRPIEIKYAPDGRRRLCWAALTGYHPDELNDENAVDDEHWHYIRPGPPQLYHPVSNEDPLQYHLFNPYVHPKDRSYTENDEEEEGESEEDDDDRMVVKINNNINKNQVRRIVARKSVSDGEVQDPSPVAIEKPKAGNQLATAVPPPVKKLAALPPAATIQAGRITTKKTAAPSKPAAVQKAKKKPSKVKMICKKPLTRSHTTRPRRKCT